MYNTMDFSAPEEKRFNPAKVLPVVGKIVPAIAPFVPVLQPVAAVIGALKK